MSPQRRRQPGGPHGDTAQAPENLVLGSPPGPAFFLSYARAQPPGGAGNDGLTDADAKVKDLFRDLNVRMRHLLPLRAGEPAGFMDDRMEAGTLWNEELLRNLGTSRVFVALLSPPYLERSEWCPMEWDYFTRRKVTPRPGVAGRLSLPTAVIPVLWTPITEELPPIVNKIQRFTPPPVVSPEHIQLYEAEGVMGMSDVNPGAYRAVVWALARQIQRISAALDVAPSDSTRVDRLRRAFGERAR